MEILPAAMLQTEPMASSMKIVELPEKILDPSCAPNAVQSCMVSRCPLAKHLSVTSDESSLRSSVTTSWHSIEVTHARRQVERLFRNSGLADRIPSLPKFTEHEIIQGKFLGEGAFGTVHEIREFHVEISDHSCSQGSMGEPWFDDDNTDSREFIARSYTHSSGESRYAVKRLRSAVIADREQYCQGVVNMVMEARMLGAVDHPNIIKLHAVAACNPYKQPGFFLIMDRLYDTLEKRLTKWQQRQRSASFLFGVLDRKGVKRAALLEERTTAAAGLSSALEYLHEHGIVHRDLKPENIGFDFNGKVKLFDFSISTPLHTRTVNADGTYNLTGMTGSLRYMAREVALEQPYNESCDVYSFAILFWEMYALSKPFGLLTSEVFMRFVVQGDMRPPIPGNDSWPSAIKKMLTQCWSRNAGERLSMKEVASIVSDEATRASAVRSGTLHPGSIIKPKRSSLFKRRSQTLSTKHAGEVA